MRAMNGVGGRNDVLARDAAKRLRRRASSSLQGMREARLRNSGSLGESASVQRNGRADDGEIGERAIGGEVDERVGRHELDQVDLIGQREKDVLEIRLQAERLDRLELLLHDLAVVRARGAEVELGT